MKRIALALAFGLATLGLTGTASAAPRGYGGGYGGHNRGYDGGNYNRGNSNHGNFNYGNSGYNRGYNSGYRPAYGYTPYRGQGYGFPAYGYSQPGVSLGFNFFR